MVFIGKMKVNQIVNYIYLLVKNIMNHLLNYTQNLRKKSIKLMMKTQKRKKVINLMNIEKSLNVSLIINLEKSMLKI
jgi:hypothetical protein